MQRVQADAESGAVRLAAASAAESRRLSTAAEVDAMRQLEAAAEALAANPALLRLRELETLRELARNGNARIYIGFDKHMPTDPGQA